MDEKELLPIGSVVELEENSIFHHMIIGYYFVDEDGKSYQYSAVMYPYGVEDEESFYAFNEEDIVNVLFEGYRDEESNKLLKHLPALAQMSLQNDKKDN